MMIQNGWARVPVFYQGIVPVGIGSAKLLEAGGIEMILPAGDTLGAEWFVAARNGMLDGLLLKPRLIPAEPKWPDYDR
jgi:hypothetical protein